ncbi:HNH endonuclease [Hydrogenophaga aromaticivorans]|uniref:HNH endonuclease n=1 Tax=Hydrogenophaga aromaticivorans TaxID=2610898 RepID=UPI003CD0D496
MIYDPEHPLSTAQGYVAQHRLVVERILGRYLERHEVVHHIDGNPRNNAPSNLQVFDSNADHLRHELKGRVPKWSEDGRKRIEAGSQKGISILHGSKRGGGQQPRTSGHQT